MKRFFLFFSHSLSEQQTEDIKSSFDNPTIVCLPVELQGLWSGVPTEISGAELATTYICPFLDFLAKESRAGDYLLIQGDFGMTFAVADWCLSNGRIPLYSTTRRQARELRRPDGLVEMTHVFAHCGFREYRKHSEG